MRIIRSKLLSGLVILAIGWLALSFIKIKTHENIVNKEVGDLEGKIAGFEKNNSILERFLGYMSHSSGLEKEARLKLNYKAPGEEVAFIYTDDSAKAGSVSNDFNKQLAQMPNYLKWAYYLLGY